MIFYQNHRQKMCQYADNLSKIAIANGFNQKSSFFCLPDSCFNNQISFLLLSSLEDSCEHYYKNVKRSDKELDENYRDNYLDMRKLFLISDDRKMKGNMNIAILESFVNFYKNHSKIISPSFYLFTHIFFRDLYKLKRPMTKYTISFCKRLIFIQI